MAGLRIMTFNLRRDVETDGTNRWNARRDLVAGIVMQHMPDLVGTQEGLPHQLDELDARLVGYARVGAPRDGASDEACALYYSLARWKLLDSGTFWLSQTPDTPASATWGNRLPRIVTWVRVEDRTSGREVLAANTHLDHESDVARRQAAHLLAQRLPGAILMGDLNAAPGDATHSILLRAGWDDGGATEPTFHGFTGRARARIDHVLAPRSHAIVRHQVIGAARGGVHASDHHAVLVHLELRAA